MNNLEDILNKYKSFDISKKDLENFFSLMEGEYYKLEPALEIIEKYKLSDNFEELTNFLNDLRKLSISLDNFDKNRRIILKRYNKSLTIEDKAYFASIENGSWENLYKLIFSEEQQHSYEVVSAMLKRSDYRLTPFILEYINSNDRLKLIDEFYIKMYKNARYKLSNEELDYVIKKIRETDEIFLSWDTDKYKSGVDRIMAYWKCDLLKKLKKVYGKSYVDKTGKSLDDEDEFVFTMLNSNVLEQIYTNSMFTLEDTEIIKTLLTYYEENNKDVTSLRNKIDLIAHKNSIKEKNIYSYLLANKDNKEAIDNYLGSLNITKDNFKKYIASRKFIDKKIKEAILLMLSKHFEVNYISVYDILEMIEESHDRDITLKKVLDEKGIDVKYFDKVYKKLKEENPDIYELINTSIKNKDTKKMLKIYESIKNDNVNNYDYFIKKFKQTPEEVLEFFSNSPLHDEVYEEILKWYDFRDGLPSTSKKTK